MLQQDRQMKSEKWHIPPSTRSWFKYAWFKIYPSIYQWAAVFRSRRVNCWSSCNTWSCPGKEHWCSCRSTRMRLTDCCPQTPNLRRKPDSTRRGPTLTAQRRHTGGSGRVLKVRATKWQCVLFWNTWPFETSVQSLSHRLATVGWNNSRASWRKQPAYVSGVRFRRNFLSPAAWHILPF